MRKTLAIVVLGAAFFAAACGDDSLSRSEAREQLIEETGVTEDLADCVLDVMDDLDIDYSADEEDVPEDKRDEFIEKAAECGQP